MSPAPDVRIPPPRSGGGYLYELAVTRHLIERQLDPLFRGLPVPPGTSVLLYNETDAGLGDVAFATKLMRHLLRWAPGIALTLVSSDPAKQQTFGLPAGVTLWDVADFAAKAPAKARRPALLISAPGIFNHCRIKAQACEILGLDDDVPFLYLAEYGSLRQLKDDAFKPHMPAIGALRERYLDEVAGTHGIDPDEMGHSGRTGAVVTVADGEVRQLDHLTRALTSDRPDNPLFSWLISPSLGARSCGLEAGELGIHIEEPLRDAALDSGVGGREPGHLADLADPVFAELLLGGADPASVYPDCAALYAGYAYEGLDRFLSYVAVLEAEHSRRIDVVVPNRGDVDRVTGAFLGDDVRARLAQAGVGWVEIHGNAEEEGPERATLASRTVALGAPLPEGQAQGGGSRPPKVLRLITRYPLPHADMRTLLRASEPATLVSGDQSFSEAVSAGKAIVYLEPVYCQTFHLDAALALARQLAPEVAEILDFGMQLKWDDTRWAAVADLLRRPDLYALYTRFDEAIWRDHEANRALVDVIVRTLWTLRSAPLRDAQQDLLERAWSSWSADDGVLVAGRDLGRVAAVVAGLSRGA